MEIGEERDQEEMCDPLPVSSRPVDLSTSIPVKEECSELLRTQSQVSSKTGHHFKEEILDPDEDEEDCRRHLKPDTTTNIQGK